MERVCVGGNTMDRVKYPGVIMDAVGGKVSLNCLFTTPFVLSYELVHSVLISFLPP